MAGRLEGKVALVTGAARGQGRSHAVRLAAEGADIIALDICAQIDSVGYPMATVEDLDETVNLVEKEGRRIVTGIVDIRDADALTAAVDEGVKELSRLDIVLGNAGIMPIVGPAGDTPAAFQDAIDVMVIGTWNTLRATVPEIRRGARGGAVVLTSSMAAIVATPEIEAGVVGYFSAKTALLGMMRCYAAALAPEAIRVNLVCPTGCATPMVVNEPFMEYAMTHTGVAASLSNALPVPMIEPIDISEAILYMVADSGRYVTGTVHQVDAGCPLGKIPQSS